MSPLTCYTFIILQTSIFSYEIVYPKFYSGVGSRQKRSTELTIVEIADWILEYEENSALHFTTNFTTEYHNDKNISSIIPTPDCSYLNGQIKGVESHSAVTICDDQLTGVIKVNREVYFVQPATETDQPGAHILYSGGFIRESVRMKRDLGSVCFTTEFYNLTGDVETADDDKVIALGDEEQRGNGRNDEDTEDPSWRKEQIDPEEMGYFYDSAWETRIFKKKTSSKISAPRRWLEIAIGADYSVINFHGKNKVQRYILALMNIVSAIYQDPSLEANLQLVLTRMILYDHKKFGQIKEKNARKSLENVNAWNKKLHTTLGVGEQHHDLAVWLTRVDLGGPSGYAPVGGVCDPVRSCTLNRDEGLTSAFIIAHEMAHVLGLTHDGDTKANNNCDKEATDGSVMAPMVSATFNKFLWSTCSKNEFHKRAANWYCLKNPPPGKTELILKPTLHTTFSMDDQCRMEFGDGYKMCRAFDIMEPCSHLWCGHEHSPMVCKTKKGPPLEGTECGPNKYCVNGYCESDTYTYQLDPVIHNPQDGAWSEWSKWGQCSKSCGFGVQFRSRYCNNPHPAYGGSYCKGNPEEFQICSKNTCPEPLQDTRAEQCSRLPKLVRLKDPAKWKMTWLPYESEKKILKCQLVCVSQQTGEIFSSGENLVDGSQCSYDEESDICVQGICHPLGCDGSFSKNKLEDSCGICEGNNSLCLNLTSNFHRNIRREISRVGVVPRQARNIKIECRLNTVRNQVGNDVFLMMRDRLKAIRYNLTVVNDKSINTFIIRGAKFHYSKRGNVLKLWARGPILEEIVVSLFTPPSVVNSGVGMAISSSYSVRKDSIVKNCRFSWVVGGWGTCSASCGGGRRMRTIACRDTTTGQIVTGRHCSMMKRPATVIEECNKFSCRFHWVPGDWEHCTATCGSNGSQMRELYCVHYTIKADILKKTNGTGLKIWQHAVAPDRCGNDLPDNQRTCNRVPCTAHWEPLEWSQCSATCGAGTESRDFHCPPPKGEAVYTCGPKPVEQTRKCRSPFNRRNNPLCKNKKRKTCTDDKSEVCSLTDYFKKYCVIREFRKMCCKTCFNLRHSM